MLTVFSLFIHLYMYVSNLNWSHAGTRFVCVSLDVILVSSGLWGLRQIRFTRVYVSMHGNWQHQCMAIGNLYYVINQLATCSFLKENFTNIGGTRARTSSANSVSEHSSQPNRGPAPRPRPTSESISYKHPRVTENVNQSVTCPRNGMGEHALMSVPPSHSAPPPQSEKDASQQKARRRHQGEATEGEEGDATPDLFLKHLDTTLVTYV
jgi:hypothetical protein